MSVQRKKRRFSVLWLLLLVILAGAALALALLRPKGDAAQSLQTALDGYIETSIANEAAESQPDTLDTAIRAASRRCLRYSVVTPFEQKLRSASGIVARTSLDAEKLTEGLSADMQTLLAERAAVTTRASDLYTENGDVLPELYDELYGKAITARLARAEEYCRVDQIPVSLSFTGGEWKPDNLASLFTGFPTRPGYEENRRELKAEPIHYTLPRTGPGPAPNPACYGETSDPAEIAALLETPTAKRLIGGQKTDFDPRRDMLGRTIYYYLDETILTLVWQQDEHGAIGTFAEVFIADASQLRRKLADDTFGSYQYYYPSEFAAQTNAVLACSGDFYNSGRSDYGLYVYDGELMRFNLSAGQSCLFSGEGDMLFVYENQFADEEEARRFIRDNDVQFSLTFGPVIADGGQDVTPHDWYFGEVTEGYARCAVGQLGKRHYLMMTINVEYPDHDVYVTLRQAADSMLAHGCVNAYTLDGGQTGSILIGGRLINPVQFGTERQMSDIFYFATALPENA